MESCVAGEDAARKELEKDWAKFPGAERTQCIQTAAKGGSPSYVEIIVCLEMMRDLRARKEAQKDSTEADDPGRDAQAVKYRLDRGRKGCVPTRAV